MPSPSSVVVERHPHLASPLRPGWVRVDMHSHTMFSGDSTTTLEETAEAVLAAGLDVLCITDHNALEGARRLREVLGHDSPCRVVAGEEVRTHTGEIIGLFLTERIPFGSAAAVTARAIADQGGVVYVPHPFDPMRANITEASLDDIVSAGLVAAIEAVNAKTNLQSLNDRARRYGEQHGLALGAGSDAHVPDALGAAYVEMPDFDGPTDFVAKLREGRTVGHHWDRPRPWSPRIVPSVSSD